jgi:Protein of unknown function (DUF3500)
MNRYLWILANIYVFLALNLSIQAQESSQTATPTSQPVAQPVKQAKQFLDGLDPAQKAKALLPIESAVRTNWHFIPMATRKGLPLMEMNDSQKNAALELLRSCVSPLGFQQAEKIMRMESLLKTIEGDKGQNERNPVKYYFTIFGQPALEQRWGISIEGHHLSLNFVLRGNEIVDSTPQFFAANPAELKSEYEGFKKGLAILKPEQQLAFDLFNSLPADQQQKATLAGQTPTEIRAAGQPQPPGDAPQGIAAAELNESQQKTLKQLLTTYTDKMRKPVADNRWKLIEEAGWDKVKFSWSGSAQEGKGHYYIVQGPTFLVEFINVQPDAAGNPANHIHCVWRDMTGDFDLPIH